MNITKPNRVTRIYTQQLNGTPDVVFPLFCPVRETEWIKGWDPPLVVTSSGKAEPDCVFTTREDPIDTIWYITCHDPGAGFIEMIRITPGVTACRLNIQLREIAGGSEAVISYTHTSVGPEGDVYVASFTEDYYRQFMQEWENRLNRYLLDGATLRTSAG